MRCLVDLDGVLVDLLTGWCQAKGFTIPNPYPFGTMQFAHMFPTVNPKDVWNDCGQSFWANLPMMPDAELLVSDLQFLFGRKVFPITSIVGPPVSAVGKIQWLARNLPHFAGSYFITSQRTQLADQKTILIDDDEVHIAKFRKAGGHAVLMPRIWNCSHDLAHKSLVHTMSEVARLVRAEQYY